VLVRQKPGSAKGVMFITLEDETGIANLVIWPSLFEKKRRVILSARAMAVKGCVQREGDVIHIVGHDVSDLSPLLDTVGDRDHSSLVSCSHGDQGTHAGGSTSRKIFGNSSRDTGLSGRGIDPGIMVQTRDFR